MLATRWNLSRNSLLRTLAKFSKSSLTFSTTKTKEKVKAEDAREIRVPIPYGHIAGKEWGNIGGYPILCLHGFVDNCDSFTPLGPYLSDKFHYIALDAYGHGLTSHLPFGAPMNFWDLVIFVRRTVDYFKLRKLSIIGHSMGGSTGLLYASIYPETVDCLLTLDIQKPVCLPLPWHSESISEAIELYLNYEKKLISGRCEKGCTIEDLVQHYVQSMNGTISPEAARLLMIRGSKPSREGYVFAHDTRVVLPTILRFTAEEQRKIIKGLRCHLKIVKAKQGPLYESKDLIEEFKGYYKQQCASYEYDETIDGTHHFHMHTPEKVAPIINEYFSRILI